MRSQSLTINLDNSDQTCLLAQNIGKHLEPGDTILLAGGVGAGKTHFARCLILSHLYQPEDVPSPTYTIVQTYPGKAGEIWHADLYRLSHVDEIDELGLIQAFEDAICLIEWPDRLGNDAPEAALNLTLDAPDGDDKRVATLTWSSPVWDVKLQRALND